VKLRVNQTIVVPAMPTTRVSVRTMGAMQPTTVTRWRREEAVHQGVAIEANAIITENGVVAGGINQATLAMIIQWAATGLVVPAVAVDVDVVGVDEAEAIEIRGADAVEEDPVEGILVTQKSIRMMQNNLRLVHPQIIITRLRAQATNKITTTIEAAVEGATEAGAATVVEVVDEGEDVAVVLVEAEKMLPIASR